MLKEDAESNQMSRALLTNGERDAIRDDPEMDASTKSSHLSRVRAKIERLHEDARLLRDNRPELYEQVCEAVVEEELDERIQRLEQEVEELRDAVDDQDAGADGQDGDSN